MAVLYDFYNTGDNSAQGVDNTGWYAQTFTTSDEYAIESVKLLIYRAGTPGTVTVTINTTLVGKPTGTVLCTGTTDGNTLPTASPFEWREITFTTTPILSTSTQYAIVVHSAAGTINWRLDSTSPTYTGGTGCINPGGGDPAFWSIQSGIDTMFETYGNPPSFKTLSSVVNITTTTTSNLSVQGVRLLETVTPISFNQSGNLTVTGFKPLSSTVDIVFNQSGNLTILGSQFLDGTSYITFTTQGSLSNIPRQVEWLINRPQHYDEESVWGYDSVLKVYRWMTKEQAPDILATSGGRYHQQLVVVGHKCVYYLEI